MSDEKIITVTNLIKHYGDIKAVDGLSYDVTRGQIFSFLGPNGAGKTPTVEMMEGLRTPTSGKIEIFGVDVTQHGLLKRVRDSGLRLLALNRIKADRADVVEHADSSDSSAE